jgi:hypothetical protein
MVLTFVTKIFHLCMSRGKIDPWIAGVIGQCDQFDGSKVPPEAVGPVPATEASGPPSTVCAEEAIPEVEAAALSSADGVKLAPEVAGSSVGFFEFCKKRPQH